MKKAFVSPQLQAIKMSEKDVIMLSVSESEKSMELDLEDVFTNVN